MAWCVIWHGPSRVVRRRRVPETRRTRGTVEREVEAMDMLADAGLGLKIKVAIIADDSLEARNIHVTVNDGVARLTGAVRYDALRGLAEGIALRSGARGVVDELQVSEPAHRPSSAIIPEDAPRVTTPPGAEPVDSPALGTF